MSGPPNYRHSDSRNIPPDEWQDDDYWEHNRGYTVPYQAPRKQSTPRRPRHRIKLDRELRGSSRFNSMSWWRMKVIHGLILGSIPFVLGIWLVITGVLFSSGAWFSAIGIAAMLGGLAVMLWHALAPVTCKWIVTVPKNHYWVVEDGNGITAEYLPPGRLIVPFRLNSAIHEYVNFHTVVVKEFYEDVLRGYERKVDLEIGVVLVFNPSEADPRLYGWLRTMTRREQFQDMIASDVRDAVAQYFTQLTPRFWPRALKSPQALQDLIISRLVLRDMMGLFLAGGHPVTVYVHGMTISSAGSAPEPPPLARASFRDRMGSPFDDDQKTLPHRSDRRDDADRYPRREPRRDDQPTVPRSWEMVGRTAQPAGHQPSDLEQTVPQGSTQPFLPGTMERDQAWDDAHIDTVLRQQERAGFQHDGRRARHTSVQPDENTPKDREDDTHKPRTTPPMEWIRRRDDDQD